MELLAGAPVGQLVLIRDVAAEQESKLRRLLQRREVPILLELVRGLMIMLAVVLLVCLLAPSRGLARELGGVVDTERGHPCMRQRKMIAAKIVSSFGSDIAGDGQVQPFCDLLRHRIHRSPL